MALERHQLVVALGDGRALVDAHHQWDAWPVNVAVEQADFFAALGQGAGQVRRDGGLANATLAAGHGDDACDAGCLLRPLAWSGCAGLRLTASRRLLYLNVSDAHAVDRLEGVLADGLELLGGLGVSGGQMDGDADRAIGHGNVLHDAEGDNVPRVAGVLDCLECI